MEKPSLAMPGNKILFVDDETDVLKSIERELSPLKLELFLAPSAVKGIDILEGEKIDIVASDLHMPEMDGLDFLWHVKDHFPDAHRLILSDGKDQSRISSAITRGYATSFQNKPWEDNSLRQNIESILNVRQTLKERKLLEAISEIDKLPSLPEIYQEFIEAVFKDRSASDIAKILEHDASLSTRLLQVANSAFYGTMNILFVERAIMRLGLNTVKDMVLAFSFVDKLDWTANQKRQLQGIFNHSAWVNRYMKVVYKAKYGKFPMAETSSIGLTHDLGKVIMLQYFPERFEAITRFQAENPGKSFHETETEIGYNWFKHEEVGAFFLNMWNLPDLLVNTALYHHEPERASQALRPILEVLAFTNELVTRIEMMEPEDLFDKSCVQEGFVSDNALLDLVADIKKDMNDQYPVQV